MVSSFLLYAGCIGFAVGIFARSLLVFGMPEILWVAVVGIGVFGIWQKKAKLFFAPHALLLAVFLLLCALGSLRMDLSIRSEGNDTFETQLGTKVSLEGIVIREPDIRTNTQHLYVAVDDQTLLVTTDRYREISYGDKISFEGALALPESFQTDLGRTFNYPRYLQARDVRYTVSFASIRVTEHDQGNALIASLLRFKHAFMEQIELVIPQPHVGLAEGLLLGVKQALGDDVELSFRKTGIMHVVVLSGYNIMLVVLFITYMLALILPLRGRLIVCAVAIVLFALMVGLGATVLRASAMALLALVAQATGRTYAVFRALCLTGVAMLLWNPYLLVYDVGFQLSFIATVGLIVVSPLLQTYFNFMPTKFKLREFLTATIATQILVTPILLYHMGEFSVVAVVVNMLVLPIVPVAMLLTFITGVAGFVHTSLALPFAYMAYVSLAYILAVAERFAQLPFASIVVPAFPFYVVVISYIVLAYLLWKFFLWSPHQKESSREEVKTKTETESESVAGWTIIDEGELKATGMESLRDSMPATPKTETPIFFR